MIGDVIKVTLPEKSYNIGISVDGNIFADSNDSANWWYLSVPLPKAFGEWVVDSEEVDTDSGSLILYLKDVEK